jgi:sirohydrochlorin cobaltochelatase
LISTSAYLLVFHGSRDLRAHTAAINLRNLLAAKYQSKNILTQQNYLEKNSFDFESKSMTELTVSNLSAASMIEVAALEMAEQSLCESLMKFAQTASLHGFKKIKVVPLFLAPGVHVQSDIPAEIVSANQQLDNHITIELSTYLGKYSGIVSLLRSQFAELSAKTRILIAHGSKLMAATEYYQNLAQQLDAEIAYWSTTPKFSQQIKTQIALGSQKIAILPYFLFPGKITEAIAQEVANLQQEYPHVELRLGKPLGATPAIAELIAQEA